MTEDRWLDGIFVRWIRSLGEHRVGDGQEAPEMHCDSCEVLMDRTGD